MKKELLSAARLLAEATNDDPAILYEFTGEVARHLSIVKRAQDKKLKLENKKFAKSLDKLLPD